MEGADLVKDVTCDRAFAWRERSTASQEAEQREFGMAPDRPASRRLTVAAYDFGVKFNILRRLQAYGCDVHVFPAKAPAADLLALNPDGIFLSNGPGDPAALTRHQNVALVDTDAHVRICPGTRFWARVGGDTFKLLGRGRTILKELRSGKVEITRRITDSR
jgi:carbamoyl-phosphate synthase small subunit